MRPPAGVTAGWNAQRHLNASTSVSGARHGASIALRGTPGDIWLQLQEGPDMPLWWKRDVSARNTSVTRGGTSRGTPAPASGCQTPHPTPHLTPNLEGSSNQSLFKARRCLQRSPSLIFDLRLNRHWRILERNIRRKGRKWARPALSLPHCQLKRGLIKGLWLY